MLNQIEPQAFWFVESRADAATPWQIEEGFDSLAIATAAAREYWGEVETRIVVGVVRLSKGASA